MRSACGVITAALVLIVACLGCSGAKDNLKEIPSSLISVSPARKYIRKIAVLPVQAPPTAVGRQVGERYGDKLVETLHGESDRITLVTYKHADFPAFFTQFAQQNQTADNLSAVSAAARQAGYNGWILARINGVRHVAKQTGFLWFAKLRHFVFFELNLTFYDAITGAKIVDEVVESFEKIEEGQFQALENGEAGDYENLVEALDDIAEDQAEKVDDALGDLPWRTPVVKVENDRIFLPAGSGAGLRVGDRLTVFEGRRTFEGQNSEQFMLPGFQIARIEIIHVSEQMSEAKALNLPAGNTVQPGDFAAAVK